MKAIVDASACTGCELCVTLCPEVFEMDGNVAKVKAEVPASAAATCKEAADSCPVSCIVIA